MNSRIRFTSLVFATTITMLANAVFTVPAFADDDPPPPPAEDSEPSSAPAQNDSLAPIPAAADAIAHVPGDSEIVVLDQVGRALPLATEEAAQIIAASDPVWCPSGVAPQNGTGGCTSSQVDLFTLTDGIATNAIAEPTANGVIWITAGADGSTSPIVIDGSDADLGSWKNFSLTFNGGWNGTFGSKVTNALTPSTFTQNVVINNWNADVTVNDISISGVAAGEALTVRTNKKITLNRVKANGSILGNGALLDNEDTGTASDITITSSEFNANQYSGLYLTSNGTITLSSVLANSNVQYIGVYLDNSTAVTAKNVVLTSGTFQFNDNGEAGLKIYSKGSISLKDMTATGNLIGDGVLLDNTASTTAAGITISGINVFALNAGKGLEIHSDGKITASNVIANNNTSSGAILDNSTAATALAVTLTGHNEFMFDANGLSVTSKGAINLSNILAIGNIVGNGTTLDNNAPIVPSNVTLTGTNILNNNHADGLVIDSVGMISLSNVTANNNGILSTDGFGADIDNSTAATPKAVTLTGANTFNNNYSGGITVASKGAITINNLTASDNDYPSSTGANLDNSDSPASPQNVTLTGTSVFNNNGSRGLSVNTYGMIAIGPVTANENGSEGAVLDNLQGGLTTLPKTVTLSGALNTFNGNAFNGLYVFSLGAVNLNGIVANENGADGLGVENYSVGAVGGITLNGSNSFEGNLGAGLRLTSLGTITVKNFTANSNYAGVVIFNANPGSVGTVIIGTNTAGWCNSVSDNTHTGLDITSYGTITLNNICAGTNGTPFTVNGANLNNAGASVSKAVILNGTNSFNDNHGVGLNIVSKGSVTLNNVTATGNLFGGIALTNEASGTTSPQNVTITGYADVSDNAATGLEIDTYGAVTLTKLHADSNGGDGINVDNQSGTDPSKPKAVTLNAYVQSFNNNGLGLTVTSLGAIKINNLDASAGNANGATLNNQFFGVTNPVTLTGFAMTNGNDANGLTITSYGSITIANLNASGNGSAYGASLNNAVAGSVGTVTLTGTNTASDNGTYGLQINSNGAVITNNLSAEGNTGSGVTIINNSVGPQPVTVSGTNIMNNNGSNGLDVTSLGTIKVNSLTADGNTYDGASLQNRFAAAVGGITLTGTNYFDGNGVTGLSVTSAGGISTNNITANGNIAGYGASLYSDAFGGPQVNVVLTGSNTFNNNGFGLRVRSEGQITVNNLSATENTMSGAYLNNTTYGYNSPGVKLTGTNAFFGSIVGPGLEISALGTVDISKVYSNDNVTSGLLVTANGNILVTCGSMNSNGAKGWDLTSTSGTITLKGVFSFGNTLADTANVTPVVVRNCPLP